MSFSTNELNLNGGSSTHLNASYDVPSSAATASPIFGHRLVLKELNTNEHNTMVSKKESILFSPMMVVQFDYLLMDY
ncbi:hypothetical protein DOY81_004737 [Sarcophaga bullata]|nr:hypothetical protein DOY81_004737 [Sarcophaga bullata]